MASIWCKRELADEIIKGQDVLQEISSMVADVMSGRIDISQIVENLSGVLVHKDPEIREKGMSFLTRFLQELPKDFLSDIQLKFISKFYIDRLKDNHRVIPAVLEGFLTIVDMKNYNMKYTKEFFSVYFREVACQSQVRKDRYNLYLLVEKLLHKDINYMKSLGPDFIYGIISAVDGERDPRNLMFLFTNLLPNFISQLPLGHLVEEMFEVISCYYPIDFHPAPGDPAAVTREDLANALGPCLCATPQFGELCLVLLIEKLDSSLRLAKIDSLRLLRESCKTFKPETYVPFLNALWSSISRDIVHKTDDELKMAAHEALSALVAKLTTIANTDQAYENFVKGIIISMQTSIVEASTVSQFVQASRILLTTANSSKESCIIISKAMIPATITFYGLKSSPKLQIISLDFLGDLYELAKHWNVLIDISKEANEIPELCLTAVSESMKEYQIAGFKTVVRAIDALKEHLVLPFVEVLSHIIQHSQDDDLLTVSIETTHAIAQKYPELIMDLVVKGKCNLENLTSDKTLIEKRLNLLSSLASIDDFTKVIIEEMLKLIGNGKEAAEVVQALNNSMSNSSLFSEEKLTRIESDHGLIDTMLQWIFKEIKNTQSVAHGLELIANTVSSLPVEKQEKILSNHTDGILEKCRADDIYFLVIESLYNSLHAKVFTSHFEEIMKYALHIALTNKDDNLMEKACILIAHFLNKADHGQKFELLYELLKNNLSKCPRDDETICPKLISLYGWIAKALLLRGNDLFKFWLQKIMVAISNSRLCTYGAEAMRLITTDSPQYLTQKQHCRVSLLHKQRLFQSFSELTQKFDELKEGPKKSYLLSWSYVLEKAPKKVLNNDAKKIIPLLIDSLAYDDIPVLLIVTCDIMCHLVQSTEVTVADSLQTILPRIIKLTRCLTSMDVRMKSLQCLYEIANNYPTMLLLPHKQDVLLELAPALDDKKRLVRNMAVRARSRWFLVGAPGEAKSN